MLILDMGKQPLPERYGSIQRYPLELMQCQKCTLVQLSCIPPAEEVFASDHLYSTGLSKANHRRDAGLAATIKVNPGDLVIDIGSNDGTLLGEIRKVSPWARLLGVEPTRQADACTEEVVKDFFTSKLAEDIKAKYGTAKVITANNVLAHVPDIHDVMAGIALLLGDDGVLITDNHDVSSITDGLQVDTIYHEHIRYWSITTMAKLLSMHKLTVTATESIPAHGGSFRTWAGRQQQTGSLEFRARNAGWSLLELIQQCASAGPIYGVGATTRATPLIHFAGIADYLTCVCELSGSEKIGKMMPGTDIPIVDEARLIKDQPAYALIFSWHVADDIIPALRSKGYQGQFIIPLPTPRIMLWQYEEHPSPVTRNTLSSVTKLISSSRVSVSGARGRWVNATTTVIPATSGGLTRLSLGSRSSWHGTCSAASSIGSTSSAAIFQGNSANWLPDLIPGIVS